MFPPQKTKQTKKTLFAQFSFQHSFELEAKLKRQIIAEKTSNSIDAYLFVEHSCTLVLSMLFGRSSFCGFVQFYLFFPLILCVCVWINAIFGNEWHAWMGLGDIFFGLYWFSGVCPSGWGRTCICHSCHSHTHACPCEEWAALSPLLCS